MKQRRILVLALVLVLLVSLFSACSGKPAGSDANSSASVKTFPEGRS